MEEEWQPRGKRKVIKEANIRIRLTGGLQRATEHWSVDFTFWKTNYCPGWHCFHNTKVLKWINESLWERIYKGKVCDCPYVPCTSIRPAWQWTVFPPPLLVIVSLWVFEFSCVYQKLLGRPDNLLLVFTHKLCDSYPRWVMLCVHKYVWPKKSWQEIKANQEIKQAN